MDSLREIQQLIAANLDVPAASVHPESKASDFSEWDSVHHLIIVMELEQKFECKFSLDEIAEFDSVEKIVKAVQKRVKT